ncbi:MAG: type II/IV secretion system protein [Candidatus Chisholmbacteria bacterium]|nr:type II/IV secretion system protein [Candidatus Chisholmbacteria bacterium]
MTTPAPQAQPLPNLSSSQGRSLLDVLLERGDLTQSNYDQLKLESANTGRAAEDLLDERQVVSPEKLAEAKATYYNIPLVHLADMGVSPEAMNRVPENVARRYHLFPFGIDRADNTLEVAMQDPLDLQAIEFVEQKSGMRLKPALATATDIEAAIAERYAQSLSSEVVAALKDTGEGQQTRIVDATELGHVIREAPIAKIVSTVLEFAIKGRASDVHIEPMERQTRVRYRIDGILQEKLVLPRNVHEAVVSRIKILSNMKIDEKRIPQDGRFTFKAGDEEVDLRISSLPSVHGEKIVMRLLQKSQKVPTLPELGLRGRALTLLQEAVKVPHGIILITGPTGSGKTTTLYAILAIVNTPRVNIVTLEDPVEYEVPGVNQVQVNPKAGLTFASGLRSMLRQDPNIIMVGEIRDNETTELSIQAALTGHLVFSTLHTNSASGALPRLLDLKAEPFLLASTLTAVVGQRVVRRVCTSCRRAYTPPPEVVADIKKVLGPLFTAFLQQQNMQENSLTLMRGQGCKQCGDTGYSGRIGIFEALSVSDKIGQLILERASADQVEETAVAAGMMLMKQDGYLKILEGMTTVEEVLRVAET